MASNVDPQFLFASSKTFCLSGDRTTVGKIQAVVYAGIWPFGSMRGQVWRVRSKQQRRTSRLLGHTKVERDSWSGSR